VNIEAAAKLTGVSVRDVERVVAIVESAPELRQKIRDGLLTLDEAEGLISGGKGETTSRRKFGRTRGYDTTWSPYRKSLVLLAHVERVLDEYHEHLPLTVRQIFYRLVGTIDYPKDERAYGRLCELLVNARRAKRISFDSIRDDGVSVMRSEFFASVEDFHDETARRARRYRRDRQEGQGCYIELWCEAAGMVHQLARVANRYSVPVYSSGGFSSLTANHEVAQRALSRDVPTVLLHVGDLDPSGESIFGALTEDAAAFVRHDRVIVPQRIEAERVALTPEQVARHDLPTAPAKKSDSRSRDWKGGTCQLEALAPDVLAGIVEDAIEDWFDLDLYAEQIDAEREDRAELLALPPGAQS